MITKTVFTGFFLLISIFSFGINRFTVTSPYFYFNGRGKIHNAELVVQPYGMFIVCELTLELSTGTFPNRKSSSNYKLNLDFELPEHSIVTDAWYWRENKFIQASLLSRIGVFSESTSRENSYFKMMKTDDKQYSITMFPADYRQIKKIKFSYLLPSNYTKGESRMTLPSQLLNTSSVPLESLTVYFLPSSDFGSPTADGNSIDLVSEVHPTYGPCLKSSFSNTDFSTLQIGWPCFFKDTNRLKIFNDGTENYYQLMLPPSFLEKEDRQPRNTCFLIDNNKNNNQESAETVISQIVNNYQLNLGGKDSLRVIYSTLLSNDTVKSWLPATSTNIQNEFSLSRLPRYSNLISLITKGIQFINENGGNGKLLLITNNYNTGGNTVSEIIDDLLKFNVNNIEIDIIDYAHAYYRVDVMDKEYINSALFFSQLAEKTGGRYYQYSNSTNHGNFDFVQNIKDTFFDLYTDKIFDLEVISKSSKTKLYGRMNFTSEFYPSFIPAWPICHLGKYDGDFPSPIEVSFKYNDKTYSSIESFSEISSASDTLIKTIWNALDLSYLEENYRNTDELREYIQREIDLRILGKYTAFMNIDIPEKVCIECNNLADGGDYGKLPFLVYPNPFTNTITIELGSTENNLYELKIFDTKGYLIKSIYTLQNQNSYTWDGTNEAGQLVCNGMYLIVATFPDKVLTTKIIKR